jgi:hypothetical protein
MASLQSAARRGESLLQTETGLEFRFSVFSLTVRSLLGYKS